MMKNKIFDNYNALYRECKKIIKSHGQLYGNCYYATLILFEKYPEFKDNGFKIYSGYFLSGELGWHYCLGNGEVFVDITCSQFNKDLLFLEEKTLPLIVYSKNFSKYKHYYSYFTVDKDECLKNYIKIY